MLWYIHQKAFFWYVIMPEYIIATTIPEYKLYSSSGAIEIPNLRIYYIRGWRTWCGLHCCRHDKTWPSLLGKTSTHQQWTPSLPKQLIIIPYALYSTPHIDFGYFSLQYMQDLNLQVHLVLVDIWNMKEEFAVNTNARWTLHNFFQYRHKTLRAVPYHVAQFIT